MTDITKLTIDELRREMKDPYQRHSLYTSSQLLEELTRRARENNEESCWSCGGKGYFNTSAQQMPGHTTYGYGHHTCSRCNGTGKASFSIVTQLPEEVFTIRLDDYERSNLTWLLELVSSLVPFTLANTGDWVGQILTKLTTAPVQGLGPNMTKEEMNKRLQEWLKSQ